MRIPLTHPRDGSRRPSRSLVCAALHSSLRRSLCPSGRAAITLALLVAAVTGCRHSVAGPAAPPPPQPTPTPVAHAGVATTPPGTTPGTTAAAVTPPALADEQALLRHGIDSLLDDPRFGNAFWGVLVVDPARGDTLYARDAHKLFLPASNMKIITSAVALTQLGPDFRFQTAFALRGTIRGGVLVGDLVVIGRGDPTVSDHMMHDAMLPMRAVADSLAARGIHRITGHIVSGGDAFPDANLGFGWAWDDLTQAYSAGVDELMFNEGFATVTLHGGRRGGSPARVSITPATDYPRVIAHIRTAPAGGGTTATEPTAIFDPADGTLRVAGTVAPRDTTTLEIAYPDPALAYLHALAAAVRARGIELRRSAVTPPTDSPAGVTAMTEPHVGPPVALDTLFTLLSPPLRDIMPALLKPSQNQIAEVLLKTLGLERTGVGSADSGRRIVESQLAAWGVPPEERVIRDGSGLSRHDYLSPATIVRVLSAMREQNGYQVFYDALPIAGVNGTIAARMRGTAAAGNVHAKTGFVDRARSLSGYVTTANGVGLVFSLLCNNWTVPVHDVEAVQDDIVIRLATATVRVP